MKRRPPFLLAWCLAAGLSASSPDRPPTKLILCAAVNRDYVIGSKLVTENGLFRRTASGKFEHFGLNFPHLFNISVSFDAPGTCRDGDAQWRDHQPGRRAEAEDCNQLGHDRGQGRYAMVPDTLYLALPDGVAVSEDGGMTWARRENGLPGAAKTPRVSRWIGRVPGGCLRPAVST